MEIAPPRFRSLPTGSVLLALALASLACGDSNGPATHVALSGTVTDYVANTPLPGAFLSANELSATAFAQPPGAYRISGIPPQSILTITVSAPSYSATTSDTIQVGGQSRRRPLQAVTIPDVARQFVAAGLAVTPSTPVVIATLTDAGAPLTGVPLSSISLRDSNQSLVGRGPMSWASWET